MSLQHLRSSTANKRPVPGNMSDGQIAINTNTGSPGLFFKDSNNTLVKVGPVHVGTTAPNASPASGGTAGNSVGEQWLDTTGGTYVFKVWDGSAWRSESGTFVDVNGDVMTGALGIIAGSASAPGLYVSGDTNTGLYSPGADQLALATGGTGRLFVDASGNVGVGITPVNNFHVSGGALTRVLVSSTSAGARTDIAFRNSSSTVTTVLGFDGTNSEFDYRSGDLAFKSVGTERLRVTSAGLVGIGTSVPVNRLDVEGGVGATYGDGIRLVRDQGTVNNVILNHTFTSGNDQLNIAPAGNTATSAIALRTASGSTLATRMFISPTGSVGIGTTSPSSLLELSSDLPILRWRDTTDTSYAEILNNNGALSIRADEGNVAAASCIDFRIDASERARIDASGRLLVGTSTALAAQGVTSSLQLHGATAGQGGGAQSISYWQNNNTSSALLLNKSRGTTPGSYTIVQDGDGLGSIVFGGADGTAIVRAAAIDCQVDGTPGTNDMPGRLTFSTTADGASSPTEQLRITSDRYVRLASGTGGIQFGGDTAAANALDDYEEGTFTPTVTGSSTAGTGTYNTNGQVGRYTKIGNRVSFTIYVDWSAHTGTGNLRVSGLPFTSNSAANAFNAVALYAGSLTYTGPMLQAYFGAASTTIIVGQMTAAGVTSGVPMDTAANLTLSGHYEV